MVPKLVSTALYNQTVRFIATAALTFGLLGSCGQNLNTKEAVRQGVIDHLSTRKGLDLDMKSMDVEVTSVTFRSDEADAMVSIKARGANAASGMQMQYTLKRDGSRWKVEKKAEAGMNPHSEQMAAPPASQLPADHPPINMPKPGTAK